MPLKVKCMPTLESMVGIPPPKFHKLGAPQTTFCIEPPKSRLDPEWEYKGLHDDRWHIDRTLSPATSVASRLPRKEKAKWLQEPCSVESLLPSRLVGCRQGHPDGDAQTVTPRRWPCSDSRYCFYIKAEHQNKSELLYLRASPAKYLNRDISSKLSLYGNVMSHFQPGSSQTYPLACLSGQNCVHLVWSTTSIRGIWLCQMKS